MHALHQSKFVQACQVSVFCFFFWSKIFFANLTLQFWFFIFLKRIFIRGISTSNKNILCLFECLKPDTHKSPLVKNKKINQKCANYKKNFSKKKKDKMPKKHA